MITREQIEEIQAESREKGISIKQVLQEKGIPAHQYFGWKRKYSRSDIPEGFRNTNLERKTTQTYSLAIGRSLTPRH